MNWKILETDWVAVATTSTAKGTNGYPFVNLLSMSDGPVINGTGIPYVYMTNMDTIGQDIQVIKKFSVNCH